MYIRSDIPCCRITDYYDKSVELLVLEEPSKHKYKRRQTISLFINAYKPSEISKGLVTAEMTNMLDKVHAS